MKKLIYIAALAMMLGSCKKYFDINNNQNLPTDVEPTFVLSQTLATSATAQLGYYGSLSQWIGFTARSAAFAPASGFEAFEITQGQFQGNWTAAYHLIYDLNFVEEKAHAKGQEFFEGVAKVLKSYWYQYLVDMFNNVPYTEAAQPSIIQNPKYDDAKTIYEDLIKKIDEGIVLIKAANSLSPSDTKFDVMYNGDVTHWVKFANTVKLRILIRQSDIPGRAVYIQTEIAKIVSEGTGFIEEHDDALINPGYENSTGKQSPIYGAYGLTPNGTPASTFFRANQFAINVLKNTNDTRIDYIYKKPANGVHLGNLLGSSPNANSVTSETGSGVNKAASSPYPFLLAAESLFLQAEAAHRGWLQGSAKDLYERAITASFEYLGVPNAQVAAEAYYTQPGVVNVNWDASTDKIQAIAIQKWIALNGFNAMEAWAEMRRTGYPKIIPASLSPNVTRNQIPVRALYPQIEYDVNAENVALEGTINQFDSKIFWMK